MNLLIIGLGYSAGFFARAMQAEGWQVTGTVRSAEKAARLSADGLPAMVFDGVSASPALLTAVAQADAVLVSVQPDEAGDAALRLLGPALEAAPALGWLGYLSTIGVYGDHGGGWVDETTPCLSRSRGSQRRIAIEQDWLALGARSGKPVQIFRLSGIYGPGRNAIVKLREGKANRLIKPGQVFNRIHAEDIAGVLAASLAQPRAGSSSVTL
jgi:nucleoside-diphosphate-sugar epimerase